MNPGTPETIPGGLNNRRGLAAMTQVSRCQQAVYEYEPPGHAFQRPAYAFSPSGGWPVYWPWTVIVNSGPAESGDGWPSLVVDVASVTPSVYVPGVPTT
jgi:hypothetical protein